MKSVYEKLAGIEPSVSRHMLQETASRMQEVLNKLGCPRAEVLPGYHVRYLDGNHLRRTDRRILELREINGAPLPGQALVVLDPQRHLVSDVIPWEDGHSQERLLLPPILETVQRGHVWVADRNFCTANFLVGIMARRSHFVIREHGNSPPRDLVGRRRKIGRVDTGVVFEQQLRIWDSKDETTEKVLRRIPVELDEPWRGMKIALPDSYWAKQYAHLTPNQLARTLRDMAKHIRLSQYAKNRWAPKKKNVRKGEKVKHVSTAQIIAQRKQAPKPGKR